MRQLPKMIYFSLVILCVLAGCENPVNLKNKNKLSETAEDQEEPETTTEEIEMEEYKDIEQLHIPAWLAGKEVWSIPPEPEEGEEAEDPRLLVSFTDTGIVETVSKTLYPNPVTPEPFINAKDSVRVEKASNNLYSVTLSGTFEYKSYPIYGEVKHRIGVDGETVTHNGSPAEIK